MFTATDMRPFSDMLGFAGWALARNDSKKSTGRAVGRAHATSRRKRVVPQEGLEPPRPRGHWILSPARLPFHHWGCARKRRIIAATLVPSTRAARAIAAAGDAGHAAPSGKPDAVRPSFLTPGPSEINAPVTLPLTPTGFDPPERNSWPTIRAAAECRSHRGGEQR
jgi:hypothetical protein